MPDFKEMARHTEKCLMFKGVLAVEFDDKDLQHAKEQRKYFVHKAEATTEKKERKFFRRKEKVATIVIDYMKGTYYNFKLKWPDELENDIRAFFWFVIDKIEFKEIYGEV